MVERCKTAYTHSRWVRISVCLGLLAWGILLYALAGGFPPWAWRFLVHVLSQLPQLWAIQGSAVVVPLVGLVLLSLSLFVLWGVLLVCVCNVVLYWWNRKHEREDFAMDLLEAERMAEEAVNGRGNTQEREEYERWQPLPPMEELPPQPVHPWPSEALSQVRVPEVLPQVRQPARQRVQQPVRQRAQEEAYVAARASRVVGSSGLIRVPSATLSRGETSLSQPTRRRQVIESPTQTLSVPTRPAPRVPMEPRTQPATTSTHPVSRIPMESRTQPVSAPTRPSARVPMEPLTQALAAPTRPVSHVPMEPRTQPMQGTQPTQAISRQGRARQVEPSSVPTRALSMREQLRLVPREVAKPDYEDECEETLRFSPIQRDITTDDTLPGAERVLFEEDEEDEEGDEKTLTDLPIFPSTDSFRLLVGIGLDAGLARKDAPNEDNLFAVQGMRPSDAGAEPVGLFIVADGMGGHAHGQEASKQAVNAISGTILPLLMRPADDDEAFSELLKEGVHRANLAIYSHNREREHMMGTTLTAALMVGNRAYIVNVGDSRTYLYRAGEGLTRVTRDHSVVERLVEDGVIEREEVYTHPKRNQIYRCLGERAAVDVDMFKKDLQDNDVLVLCSDGMWEMVYDDEIERIIMSSASRPAQISEHLVQAALANGGADNISVVVVCVEQR